MRQVIKPDLGTQLDAGEAARQAVYEQHGPAQGFAHSRRELYGLQSLHNSQ